MFTLKIDHSVFAYVQDLLGDNLIQRNETLQLINSSALLVSLLEKYSTEEINGQKKYIQNGDMAASKNSNMLDR